MLDQRAITFLSVCRNKSYTKASEELCITQPAVTQHIKSLEKEYGSKFIEYKNRELKLTKAGELFYRYAENAKANEATISQKLREINNQLKKLEFAATLTIGEFTLAPILGDFIRAFHEYEITMHIDNTERVLEMLRKGEISFALVEGLFNKAEFDTKLYKKGKFILTAPTDHPLTLRQSIVLDDLKNETIIVREKGSGSREVLERGLFDKNYTLENFKRIIEIGNVNVIKNMVRSGIGLSFMYKDAALEEIGKGNIVELHVSDFVIEREFNFIYLKNSIMENEIGRFFEFFKGIRPI